MFRGFVRRLLSVDFSGSLAWVKHPSTSLSNVPRQTDVSCMEVNGPVLLPVHKMLFKYRIRCFIRCRHIRIQLLSIADFISQKLFQYRPIPGFDSKLFVAQTLAKITPSNFFSWFEMYSPGRQRLFIDWFNSWRHVSIEWVIQGKEINFLVRRRKKRVRQPPRQRFRHNYTNKSSSTRMTNVGCHSSCFTWVGRTISATQIMMTMYSCEGQMSGT